MVISNAIHLQYAEDQVLKENDDYLNLYKEVVVPHTEMERIVSILHTRGRTPIGTLVDQLAYNDYDVYVQRRYIYALMFLGEIEFDMFTPIDYSTLIWSKGHQL